MTRIKCRRVSFSISVFIHKGCSFVSGNIENFQCYICRFTFHVCRNCIFNGRFRIKWTREILLQLIFCCNFVYKIAGSSFYISFVFCHSSNKTSISTIRNSAECLSFCHCCKCNIVNYSTSIIFKLYFFTAT